MKVLETLEKEIEFRVRAEQSAFEGRMGRDATPEEIQKILFLIVYEICNVRVADTMVVHTLKL